MTLQEIYREHFQFVWRTLRRLGVRESDVEDATQDVFLVVHRRLADFEGRSRLTTWLYSICLNVARDHRRSARVRREVPYGETDAATDEGTDVVGEVERREGRAVLERILNRMTTEQRTAFVLFELERMKCDDIANLLQVPVGTVYSRLRLARGTFKRCLTQRRVHEDFHLGCFTEWQP